MRPKTILFACLTALVGGGLFFAPKPVEAAAEESTTHDVEKGPLERRSGLLNLQLDRAMGRVWLELPAESGTSGTIGTFLYSDGLTGGLGSNPVGLDRGELGPTRVVELRRMGDRLLVIEPNLKYRAEEGSMAEKRAVEASFAKSVLWAGEVDSKRLDGKDLVDLTPFLIRDSHDITTRLRTSGQGTFKLDETRSVADLEATHVFPDNIELEALLTYRFEATSSGDQLQPGDYVLETAPSPRSVTLIVHQSLIRLPEPGYQPRHYDPRTGALAIQFADYSASLDDTIERRWVIRHRLEKSDPGSAKSKAVEPIVYYIDPAIPEPMRSAVFDGVRWWTRAFEEAGFEDGFRVELLPEGAHPLDVRYNIVEWVHRSTRGWSYGGGIVDPRTGERLKGHVRLGSLRVRQDRLLFEGLAGTDKTGSGSSDDPVQLALARIRQLAAHEVGHTIGLDHNFAASTYGRASVMDYPAPLVTVDSDERLEFGDAYGIGVGDWDLHAIRYSYSQFAPGADETRELQSIARQGIERGLVFLTDHDARPAGAAEPLANLWDNGSDPVAQLELEMEVRRIALAGFGQRNIPIGQPLALLEEALVPLYLHHRYQLAAAAKVVGGAHYRYAIRDDGQQPIWPIDAAEQRRALSAVLATISPEALDLPESLLDQIPPRPAGYEVNREQFATQSAPIFDPLGVAATAADMAIGALVQHERAARMIDFHRRNPQQPDFSEVLTELRVAAFSSPDSGERHRALGRRVQSVLVAHLIELSANQDASPAVRARAEAELSTILETELAGEVDQTAESAHRAFLSRSIDRALDRPAQSRPEPYSSPSIPPGQPIGASTLRVDAPDCSWSHSLDLSW